MRCHEDGIVTTSDPKTAVNQPLLMLVGNPNVGKSVLFTKLTGKFVVISNYPGTTVEIARGGTFIGNREFAVLGTPGVNEFAPRTEDARVTCDVLRDHPSATIVQVADAKNLRRAHAAHPATRQTSTPDGTGVELVEETPPSVPNLIRGKPSSLTALAQAVTKEIEGQHSPRDGHAGGDAQPGRNAESALFLAQHHAPLRHVGLP